MNGDYFTLQKMKQKMLIVVSIFVYSCTENNEKQNDLVENENRIETSYSKFLGLYYSAHLTDSLKQRILDGDMKAYAELRGIYLLSDNRNEFLFYAVYMAENNDSKEVRSDLEYLLTSGTKLNESKFSELILKNYILGDTLQ